MINNSMPSMPSAKSLSDSDERISTLIASELESSPKNEDSALEVPDHKPEINTSGSNSNIEAIVISKNEIKVVALRKGFYNQHRLKDGEEFTVKKFDELGEWMKCLDPDLQKKHLENIKVKKARK